MPMKSLVLCTLTCLWLALPGCSAADVESSPESQASDLRDAEVKTKFLRSKAIQNEALRKLVADYEFKTESGDVADFGYRVLDRDVIAKPLTDREVRVVAKHGFNCSMDACDIVGQLTRVKDSTPTAELVARYRGGQEPSLPEGELATLEANLTAARAATRVFSGRSAEGNDGPEFRRDLLVLVDDAHAEMVVLVANKDLPLRD